jgi:hypothetical protein
VANNLNSHRVRNRKSSIMFSVAVGFIVFVTVAYKMQIESTKQDALMKHGGKLVVKYHRRYISGADASKIDAFLQSNKAVAAHAWTSTAMSSGKLCRCFIASEIDVSTSDCM